MKYTVTWLKASQDQLTQLWIDGPNRQEITDASNVIDIQLRLVRMPIVNLDRVQSAYLSCRLWCVLFDVIDDDRMVTVFAVWRTDQ